MRISSVISSTLAGCSVGIALSAAAVAQPWVGIAGGGIQNPNVGGNVGINIAPAALPPLACDPLHVGSQGAPAALRLSAGPVAAGACACGFGRLGYEPPGAGGFFAPGISTPGDLVLVTGAAPLGGVGSCSEDVIVATAGRRNGRIRFATQNAVGAAALVERMTITNGNGFIGVNNPLPAYQFDITGDLNFNGNLYVNGATGVPGDVLGIDAFGNTAWVAGGGPGTGWSYNGDAVAALTTIGTTTAFDFPVITSNIERMRVTSSGNVGIGTTTPTQLLEVNGNAQVNGDLMLGSTTSRIQDASASFGNPGDVLQNDAGGYPRWTPSTVTVAGWQLTGNAGTVPITSGGGNYLGTVMGSGTDLDIATDGTVAMTIGGVVGGNKGNVLIGGTSAAGNLYRLEVTGDSYFGGNVTVTGTFTVSDARLKENVATIDNALARVKALRGVTYDFRPGTPERMNLPRTRQVGFIAQEVQQVVPEAVGTTEQGYLSVNYPELIPVLVEGMKEQQATIQSQQAQIDALATRLAELERQVAPAIKVPEKTEGRSNLRVR